MPDPRLKDRQMTCGDPECKRQWHRRKCAEWNKDNPDYFKENYLQRKMENAGSKSPSTTTSRFHSGLPLEYVQEVIGIQHLVIIEYFGQLIHRRFQEVIRRQLIVKTKKITGLIGQGVQEAIDSE